MLFGWQEDCYFPVHVLYSIVCEHLACGRARADIRRGEAGMGNMSLFVLATDCYNRYLSFDREHVRVAPIQFSTFENSINGQFHLSWLLA